MELRLDSDSLLSLKRASLLRRESVSVAPETIGYCVGNWTVIAKCTLPLQFWDAAGVATRGPRGVNMFYVNIVLDRRGGASKLNYLVSEGSVAAASSIIQSGGFKVSAASQAHLSTPILLSSLPSAALSAK